MGSEVKKAAWVLPSELTRCRVQPLEEGLEIVLPDAWRSSRYSEALGGCWGHTAGECKQHTVIQWTAGPGAFPCCSVTLR